MQSHRIVSREEWIAARKAHLAHEKELTQARERLSEERRALPWVKVDKDYVFDGPGGKVTLADLFKGRSQLVVQHFMFAPDWNEGCKSCSFWADGFERMIPHLAARDTTHGCDLARAARKARRVQGGGWAGPSTGCRRAMAISTTTMPCRSRRRQIKSGDKIYNFGTSGFGIEDAPGISVFYRDDGRQHLPHLFLLRPRPRHDERRLPLSRPDAARSSRRGLALSDGLGAAT